MNLYSIPRNRVSFSGESTPIKKVLDFFGFKSVFFLMNQDDPNPLARTCLPPALTEYILLPHSDVLARDGKLISASILQRLQDSNDPRLDDLRVALFMNWPTTENGRSELVIPQKYAYKKLDNMTEKIRRSAFLWKIFNNPSSFLLSDASVVADLSRLGLRIKKIKNPHKYVSNFRQQLLSKFGSHKKRYSQKLECPICEQRFTSRIKQHIKSKHKDFYYEMYQLECIHTNCDERFKNETDRSRHTVKCSCAGSL